MWKSEEISKVCLDVVQNASEGGVREFLHHHHPRRDRADI